tara:strand:- start:630 stop:935 length:306 start_codon:yes stop_codon:yes gene_type:complete
MYAINSFCLKVIRTCIRVLIRNTNIIKDTINALKSLLIVIPKKFKVSLSEKRKFKEEYNKPKPNISKQTPIKIKIEILNIFLFELNLESISNISSLTFIMD